MHAIVALFGKPRRCAGLALLATLPVSAAFAEPALSPADSVSTPEKAEARAAASAATCAGEPLSYDAEAARELVRQATQGGDAQQGVEVFCSERFACLSCHRVGAEGGDVGPALTSIGKDRLPLQISEAVLWPGREMQPEYRAWLVLADDGRAYQGYKRHEDDQSLELFDITSQRLEAIPKASIADIKEVGSVMPANLAAGMTAMERRDLVRFLIELRPDSKLISAVANRRQPAPFEYVRDPLHPEHWPHWQAYVNRDRVYDFYAKEATHFLRHRSSSRLLPEYPGLDGRGFGHWGNQDENAWRDNGWNDVELGTVLAGVFFGPAGAVPKGVCVRLGEAGELSVCFNPQTLKYEALWRGEFLRFSDVRHGFMDGLRPAGEMLSLPFQKSPSKPFEYRGFYRLGKRVIFAYRIDGEEIWDSPWAEDGKFVRAVAPAANHPLHNTLRGGPSQWPETISVRGEIGKARPYAVDTIPLPTNNPWKAPLFCGDHAFRLDGSALVSTMHGDVWLAKGLDSGLDKITWRRFASGLHQPLGILVHEEAIYVLGRDQITRLHDFNEDGEADFYECYSNAMTSSPSGHDYVCGLARDAAGNFCTASSNQGLIRIGEQGRQVDVIATGLRNPDGMHLAPDGSILAPASEGDWTPASMICIVPPSGTPPTSGRPLHFGHGGPKNEQPPALPLVYLPRGLDNSSGSQATVPDDRWGPLKGALVHFSYGAASHFLLIRDEVNGVHQGAVVPLSGEFLSGAHRGKFNPLDGQLYVSGMDGWGTYAVQQGCFHRVRYTADRVQAPIAFHVHENGVLVRFTAPIDRKLAADPRQHFAQAWNYRYSQGYGSPEYSARHPGVVGHDQLEIRSIHVIDDRTLFVELPELQPVNTLHLALNVEAGDPCQLFVTVHALDQPYTELPNYQPSAKLIAAHPLLRDTAALRPPPPNPWTQPIEGARPLAISAGKNLTYSPRELLASPGSAIGLRFDNPDAVPHNWVLIRPGRLGAVGDLTNRLVADPESAFRQYVPPSEDVLVHTDIVLPGESSTIYFQAPKEPGRYPFLCTFPGHWMVMNGELIVRE